jgi:glycolate oxidase FAD binding subunit
VTDGRNIYEPASEQEACDMIREARTIGRRFEIRGGGTRRGLGRPVEADALLSAAGLTGITLYEPAELVVSARAGTPLATVEAALAEKGQMLPVEPSDYRALYGSHGEPTIGAVAACNISGPRRVQVGAARDHLIGVRLVNGLGEAVKSGGRVMKNVTGLDLVKLSCGAHGTLGLLTEVTFKLLPKQPAEASLAIEGLDDRAAIAALSGALGSPYEISGAAHLPAGVFGPLALTLLRLERSRESLDYRIGRLEALLSSYGGLRRIEAPESRALWRDVATAAPFCVARDAMVWRLSLPPGKAAALAEVTAAVAARHYYDWGGGLVWLEVPPCDDAGAAVIRSAVTRAGGHALLIRAPDALRASIDVFQRPGEGVLNITQGLKTSFDPDRLLNPGRMYAGV